MTREPICTIILKVVTCMNYQSDDRRHAVDCVQYFCMQYFDHLETLEIQASDTVGFTGLKWLSYISSKS